MPLLVALSLVLTLPPAQAQAPAPPPAEAGVATRLLDLDGDGALDLLTLGADGSLGVRRNTGPRLFLEVPQELPCVAVTDVLCSDLDGDGLPDLYLVSPGADVALLGQGGGLFREATAELGLVESGAGVSAERLDVDVDGLADLVVHNHGSDVLFWARADGRFEREERTLDGVVPTALVPVAFPTTVADPGSLAGATGSIVSPGAAAPGTSALTGGPLAGPTPPGSAPLMGISFDARYVNDNMNEVDSADIVDGSLTGADVSTSGGDVTFGGGATVTARKGVFGLLSSATGIDATVSGGGFNSASGDDSTVSGGSFNGASGNRSTVSGGTYNTASGDTSTVSGGQLNTAAGDFSFAAGRRAKANHDGSFVWGDISNVDKTSSTDNEFNVYAEGGARIFAVGQTTPSMVVSPSGNVGIGTASPAAPLDVVGNVRLGGSQAHGLLFLNGPTETLEIGIANTAGQYSSSAAARDAVVRHREAGKDIHFLAGGNIGTAHMTVASDGNVGIGTDSPAFKLEVNGLAHRVDNSSTWTVTSDERLKKDIHTLEGALETLLALRGVTFEYTDPELAGLRRGFVAQEVEQVVPEWVSEGEDGYKRLTLNGFEALAVEALRTLRAEKNAEVARLQAENDELRERVERLESLEGELTNLRATIATLVESR